MDIPKDALCSSPDSDLPLILLAESNEYVRKIWFKSEPLNRSTIYRLAQLQLVTLSRDQGWVSEQSLNSGSWSWFELAIYADKDATSPRTKSDGTLLQWKSHHNAFALEADTKHYGLIFDRRGSLLDSLEVCLSTTPPCSRLKS